jgi:glycerol-3-phosphate acyltransferase PlsY
MSFLLGCLCAYLLGGIPFALILVWLLKRVDLRTIGSGNVGATNAARAFGGRGKLAVFLTIYALDTAKGFVPAFFGPRLTSGPDSAAVWFGACAILGHCVSPYLHFRGGKGVATTTGVMAALDPIALLAALVVFGLVFWLTKRVFLGSLALGVTLACAVVLRDPTSAFAERAPITIFALTIAALLFVTHRRNLASLRTS